MAQTVEGPERRWKTFLIPALVLGPVFVSPPVVAAQFGLTQPSSELRFAAQVDVPAYADPLFDAVQLGAVAVIPLRENVTVVTGGSLVYAKATGRSASLTVSNAQASVQLGRDGGFVTISLTLPTTGRYTDEAYGTDAGLLLDLERPETFTPKAVSFGVYLTPRWRIGTESRAGLTAGFVSLTPAGLKRDFYGRYTLFGDRAFGWARVGVEVSGGYITGTEGADLGQRTIHHVRVHTEVTDFPFAPTLYVRFPLDDDAALATDLVAGVRVIF